MREKGGKKLQPPDDGKRLENNVAAPKGVGTTAPLIEARSPMGHKLGHKPQDVTDL